MVKHKKDVAKNYLQENFTQIICIFIALFNFVFLVRYSGLKSLWVDDLAQISFTHPGLTVFEMFNRLVQYDVQPPVFAVISAIWLRIAPYGTAWIKLPSELAVSIGVFICGMVGKELSGRRTGILCAAFAACSSTAMVDAGYSFRPYGFFFLTSSIVLLAYANRIKHIGNENRKDLICYGVALTFLVYTHYFGILVCAALFFSDVLLFINKRIKVNCISSYLITGISFAPWALLVMTKSIKQFSNFWPQPPTLKSIKGALSYLLSDQITLIIAFVIALMVLVIHMLFTKNDKRMFDAIDYVKIICLWCIIFVIGVTFIYSAFLNRTRSVFVPRYFIGLLPYVFLFLATGLDSVCNLVSENKSQLMTKVFSSIICVGFVFAIAAHVYPTVIWIQEYKYEIFEETAEWLYKQPDIHHDDVLTVYTTNFIDGWNYYYITHEGQRTGINDAESASVTANMLKNINKIYLFTVHTPIDQTQQKLIDQLFHKESSNDVMAITTYVRN